MQLERMADEFTPEAIAPPSWEVFLVNAHSWHVGWQSVKLAMPPPSKASLLVMLHWNIAGLLLLKLLMPPPMYAVFSRIEQLVRTGLLFVFDMHPPRSE